MIRRRRKRKRRKNNKVSPVSFSLFLSLSSLKCIKLILFLFPHFLISLFLHSLTHSFSLNFFVNTVFGIDMDPSLSLSLSLFARTNMKEIPYIMKIIPSLKQFKNLRGSHPREGEGEGGKEKEKLN
ncbi:hypothetical protein U3516DRAFT_765127 [Neocallimastix sp. 'constans']